MNLLGSTPLVVGLDPSLSASGLAWPSGRVEKWGQGGITTLPHHKRGLALKGLVVSVHNLVMSEGKPDLVVMEELPAAMAAATAGLGERAYLWWSLLNLFTWTEVPVLAVQPAQLKKYATGKGNAAKAAVADAIARRLPQFVTGGDDNRADAAVLCALGLDMMGHPLVSMPETHRAALAKLTLPDGLAG